MSSDDEFFSLNDAPIRTWVGKREGPGARVQGVVVQRGTWVSQKINGDEVPMIVVRSRNDDELLRCVGFDVVLNAEFTRLDPQPGDLIDIRYEGQVAGRQHPYSDYSVQIKKKRHVIVVGGWDDNE
jgi:hypothetical protein